MHCGLSGREMSLAEQIMPEDYIFPPKPAPLSKDEQAEYKARIKQLLKDKNELPAVTLSFDH